jgi:hypothetical protein
MNSGPYDSSITHVKRFQLKRVAFYGRTLFEYFKMFHLNDIKDLKVYKILDCPTGASSFVAEACNRYGINAVGCDPLFDKDTKVLQKLGEEDIEYVIEKVSNATNLYNWDFYTSLKDLRNYRRLALEKFILDYDETSKGRKRYIQAVLPTLPFGDKSFDLVLSGHFLFTYSHKFNFSFILSSIIELLRVSSKEVRIYPLQKSCSEPYERMADLLSILDQHGASCKIVPVMFEFQKCSLILLRHKDQ